MDPERVLDVPESHPRDAKAPARDHLQQALVGQRDQGLTHRHGADSEGIGQLMHRHPLAGRVLAAQQGVSQVMRGLLAQLLPC